MLTRIETVLGQITTLNAIFERRPRQFMFGTKNYGDIPGTHNPADNDPFDVFAPGTAVKLEVGVPYRIATLYGVFVLRNGNHKICVGVRGVRVDVCKAREEVRRYCKRYMATTGARGTWVSLHPAFAGIVI